MGTSTGTGIRRCCVAIMALFSAMMTFVAACGGGGDESAGPTTGPTSTVDSTGSGPAMGDPVGKVRVFNGYAPDGKAGPALDLYDVAEPTEEDEPIIEDLAYGELSEYVSPRSADGIGTGTLYMFRSGSKEVSSGADFDELQGGTAWSGQEGEQSTEVIGTTYLQGETGEEASPYLQEIVEEAPEDPVPMIASPDSGSGVLVLDLVAFERESDPEPAFQIGGKCPPSVDPQATSTTTSADPQPALVASGAVTNFSVSAGEITVGLVLSDAQGMAMDRATCEAAQPVASSQVSVGSGEQVLVLAFGPTLQEVGFVNADVE